MCWPGRLGVGSCQLHMNKCVRRAPEQKAAHCALPSLERRIEQHHFWYSHCYQNGSRNSFSRTRRKILGKCLISFLHKHAILHLVNTTVVGRRSLEVGGDLLEIGCDLLQQIKWGTMRSRAQTKVRELIKEKSGGNQLK